jgi:hypothetical protein
MGHCPYSVTYLLRIFLRVFGLDRLRWAYKVKPFLRKGEHQSALPHFAFHSAFEEIFPHICFVTMEHLAAFPLPGTDTACIAFLLPSKLSSVGRFTAGRSYGEGSSPQNLL